MRPRYAWPRYPKVGQTEVHWMLLSWSRRSRYYPNGRISDTARSCSVTGSVQRDDDGRRHILVSKRKVQALNDKI